MLRLRPVPLGFLVRDSKDPDGPILGLTTKDVRFLLDHLRVTSR